MGVVEEDELLLEDELSLPPPPHAERSVRKMDAMKILNKLFFCMATKF